MPFPKDANISSYQGAEQAGDVDTPGAGKWRVYFKSTGIFIIDDAGNVTGPLAESGAPGAHATSHQNGGSDEISVAGLSGLLADDQNPTAHATDHQNGGGDEISVAGLSGLLADDQNPTAHAGDHQSGGGDAIKLDDLAAPDDNTDLDASTSAHGLLKKLDNDATHYINGQGGWTVPAGSSGTIRSVTFVIDGGGVAITTGVKGFLEVPFACTINTWTLLADASGAIKIDVWKDTYANYPPTDADTITNAHEPEIAASGVKAQDTDLSDWGDVTIDAGDILGFNVDSAATITRCTISLKVTTT